MPFKPAIFFFNRQTTKVLSRIKFFASFARGRVNTPPVAIDVYTRHRFSESLGSRLGGPGQKALQATNEFTLFVDFCLIPLSKTCAFDVPAKNL